MNSEDEHSESDNQEIDDESIISEDDNTRQDESFVQMDESTNVQKAEALKKQLALWDSFLELRIKLQRATITCNCLPSSTVSDDDDDDELREVIDENAKLFRKTLALLLAIENRRSTKRVHEDDNNDEEDTDKNNSNETKETFKTISKHFKHDEKTIDEQLNKTYECFAPERDNVLQKWFDRTRNFAKQNRTNLVEQSPIVQIKEIMSLPDRLIKRTQTSRIDYDLVCPPSSPNNLETSSNSANINTELFDDGDFYHQLLREYIERKTTSITDPEQISKHWAQLRKLRSKLKKNLDTKASKDRKIRYNVHRKLINYMAPIDRCSFTDEAKSDLFSSLFGMNKISTTDHQQISPVNDIRII